MDTKTLNVHHRGYLPGRKPWEYHDQCLVTLCETCHAEETEALRAQRSRIAHALGCLGLSSFDIEMLVSLLEMIESDPEADKAVYMAVRLLCRDAHRAWLVDIYDKDMAKRLRDAAEFLAKESEGAHGAHC